VRSRVSWFETAGAEPKVSVANAPQITLFARIAHLVDGAVDRLNRQHGNAEHAVGMGLRYSANRRLEPRHIAAAS